MLYEQKQVWSKLDHEVLPYHWDDRAKLLKDYYYLNDVYEKYLTTLSDRLNQIHQEKKSVGYWRMVIGWWLRCFIEILYDRYLSIKCACETDNTANTWIIPNDERRWVPKDYSQFVDWFTGDEYNLFLYSRIIEYFSDLQFEYKEFRPSESLTSNQSTNRLINYKNNVRSILERIDRRVPSTLRRFVFIESYFSWSSHLALCLKMRQVPVSLTPKTIVRDFPVDEKLRNELHFDRGEDHFCKLLDFFLAQSVPSAYLEQYSNIKENSLMKFPKKPKVILTAVAHIGNEHFKFWAANNVENGSKLILAQHGGHYGTGLFSSLQDHELKIGDKYFSWGWSSKDNSHIRGLPAQKLVGDKQSFDSREEKQIYWNLNIGPRFSYRLFSIPIGSQWSNYLSFQINFAKNLEPVLRSKIICRPFTPDYGWGTVSRLRDEVPDLKFDETARPWRKVLTHSKLVIETTNLTTFLESLSANVPTILVLDEKLWEFSDIAEPQFEALKDVGIFHVGYESGASFLNAVYKDSLEWWNKRAVQDAKNRFCRMFAYTSKDWSDKWMLELDSLSGGNIKDNAVQLN